MLGAKTDSCGAYLTVLRTAFFGPLLDVKITELPFGHSDPRADDLCVFMQCRILLSFERYWYL